MMLRGVFGFILPRNDRYMKKNSQLPTKRCASIVASFLAEKKVTHVFDLTGGMIAYLEDAISLTKGIECLPMHHEQASGFAAEGYARKNQNFGVAIATSGPGATNMITSIGSCFFDSVPTLFITGQVNTESIKKNNKVRQEGFQETDIVSMVSGITKYATLVRRAEDILYELEKACFLMKEGRPGPVLLDIPIDVQRTEVCIASCRHFIGSKEYHRLVKKSDAYKNVATKKVKAFEKMLSSSRAPLIVLGNGARISDAGKKILSFASRNHIPIVSSLMGLDVIAHDELFVGYIGSNGNREANITFANADLIIALGTRLDVRQIGTPKYFTTRAKLVHVDIDKSSINYMVPATLAFENDISAFLSAVLHCKNSKKETWFSFITSVKQSFKREFVYDGPFVDPNTFFDELSSCSKEKTTVVVDVGQNQMWCAQSWKVKEGQRLLFSGGMGAMGFSLPASVGAWCADTKAPLVVITGDGGLQINIQELETVSRNQIPLKLFVINNKSLGMVREFQDLYFNKNYQSTVRGYGCPDLKKVAEAYNFHYEKVSSVAKNDLHLKKIMEMTVPVLIEVDVDMHAPLQPKIVYGHALDDQAPYLDTTQKEFLENLKKQLHES